MKIITSPNHNIALQTTLANEKAKFLSGKLRISWSQTRGGFAIFVKGRMEGQLFDSESDAISYLKNTHNIIIDI